MHEKLASIAFDHADDTRRLRGLWALHVTYTLSDEEVKRALADKSPYVRGFAIQLASEDRQPSEALRIDFARLAKEDPSPIVRLYIASATDRLPLDQRWSLLEPLLKHSEDSTDHNLPLLYWYAAEPLAEAEVGRAVVLARESAHPLLLEFMTRRIAMTKGSKGLEVITQVLSESNETQQKLMIQGMAKGLQGQRRVDAPREWPQVSAKLLKNDDREFVELVRSLAVKFGDSSELAILRRTLTDPKADTAMRREALSTLVDVRDAHLAPVLQTLLADKQLRSQALRGLANYSDPETPTAVLAVYSELSLDEKRDGARGIIVPRRICLEIARCGRG